MTNDRGAHWRVINADEPNNCNWTCFLDSLRGWSCGGLKVGGPRTDIIKATTDGGATWTTQLDTFLLPWEGLEHIAFADSLHGIAVGSAGKMYRTTDGGKHWIQEEYGFDPIFMGITYPSIDLAMLVTTEGNILRQQRKPAGVHHFPIDASSLVSVAPNPVTGTMLNISFPEDFSAPASPIVVELYDLDGRRMLTKKLVAAPSGGHIDLSQVPAGVYIIELKSPERTFFRKIVIER